MRVRNWRGAGLILTLVSLARAQLQHPFQLVSPPTTLQQPDSTGPTDWPYRALEWGEVNVISTTDTHGWLLGHQRQEASFSGDWGDLLSFVTRMKEEARRRGVDLLVVDSGDRVDGNGLVDGEPEGHVKGYTALKFFQRMPYDVVTTGNHELYKYPVARSVYENLSKHYGENYVVSNVNITLEEGAESVPIGSRFRKFRTEMGRNVTALGPLFFFKAHAKGTDVQEPKEMIKELWFREAIEEEPSFFLLVGHMSIQKEEDSEWRVIFKAIRSVHPFTPILIFGGHHHIRDCLQEDPRSMSLAAGRYMETIGWMSVSGLESDVEEPLTFSRRYLDQNRNTYSYHAGPGFDTPEGQALSKEMGDVAATFNLTHQFGVAPQSYYLSRHSFKSPKSILRLMTQEVLPLLIQREDRQNVQRMTVLNSGSIRFDIFEGPFTRNDQWIILPFTNNFEYISRVPLSTARKLLAYLNLVGEHGVLPSSTSSVEGQAAAVEHVYRQSLHNSYTTHVATADDEKLTVGYVTIDQCPGEGDDTRHRPIPSVWQPTFVATALPTPTELDYEREELDEEEEIDIIFFDFIQPDILGALNHLEGERKGGPSRRFTDKDVGLYMETLTANTLMQEFASRKWN
ncbi:hypothetical protein T439DRAFT_290562 [Meredithblackwellia eburnea MCA 4105]